MLGGPMHDLGSDERDRILRGRIVTMHDDQFEQLVLELVRREEPAAKRMSPPEKGADVLRPAADGLQAKVWQAKHYPMKINWAKCRESLHSAIERWSPSEIVFVFPRDLSGNQDAGFDEHLKQQPAAVAAGVTVTYWNQSELVARLNEHEDLKVRFFGPEQEEILAVLQRTAAAGGALGTAEDLVERAKTLSDWADRQDQRFMQSVSSGGLETPEPKWDELPYMTVSVADQSTRITIASWPREGVTVQKPTFGFHDNEEGQQARRVAVERLARGEPVEVTDGGHVVIDAPEIIRALAPPAQIRNPVVTLGPGEAIPLGIEITKTDGATFQRTVELYQVPPLPGMNGALAGYCGSVLIEAGIRLLEEPRIQLQLGLSATFDDDIAANADAADLLANMYRAGDITLNSDILFPEAGTTSGPLDEGRQRDEEKLRDFEMMRDAFSAIVFIRERLGIDLTPPEAFSPLDVDALLTIRHVLETGEGTAEFNEMAGMCEPADLAWIADRASGTVQRRPVIYEVFSQPISLGAGEYILPKLRVVDVIAYGKTPDAPARVVMKADGDPTMRFRLVTS